MKILFNATSFVKGGALQAAANFIDQAVKTPVGFTWVFALSQKCYAEVTAWGISLDPATTTVFDASPSRSKRVRKAVKSLEAALKPDIVLTLFGPSYIRFSAPHICGVADGYVTHSTFLSYRCLLFPAEWIQYFLTCLYKIYWYRQADYWITEAEVARRGFSGRAFVDRRRIFVIPNSCGSNFMENQAAAEFPSAQTTVRILCFAASYKHKNLDIIPNVVVALKHIMRSRRFAFVLTLPKDDAIYGEVQKKAEKLGVSDSIENTGPVLVKDGPALMRSCAICFMPTLLETFSATYPEAMAMGLPIVATDLSFAHEICGDAALYFKPRNSGSAADAISTLLTDKNLWENTIAHGKRQLARYPLPHEKYQRYVDLLHSIHSKEKGYA